MRRSGFSAICCLALAAQLQEMPQWQIDAGGKMAFEVASIHQTKPGEFTPPSFPLDPGDAYRGHKGGHFSADFPLSIYITFAYKLALAPEQRQALFARLPKWISTDNFEIQANAAGNPTKDQMRLMMQSLLAERFGLKIHFETQQVSVLALTPIKPGKLGPNLKPHAEGAACDAAPDPSVFPGECDVVALLMTPDGKNRLGSRNTTLPLIGVALTGLAKLGRPLVDQTGLTGRFDFQLEWVPESTADGGADVPAPGFIDAVREQLGLKLESTKALMQIPVVDSVERPSEN